MVETTKKRCGTCRRYKPRAEFARDKSRSDGLMGRCKTCDRARNRDWYARVRRAGEVPE